MSDRILVQQRNDEEIKAKPNAFVHLKAFTEQSNPAVCLQRHQSVYPTLRH
jgi:hypothetical protein